eukprot:g76398.t1
MRSPLLPGGATSGLGSPVGALLRRGRTAAAGLLGLALFGLAGYNRWTQQLMGSHSDKTAAGLPPFTPKDGVEQVLATPAPKTIVPVLFVFDLDDCLWTPEMYTLWELPGEEVFGDLNGRGRGVVGVRSGRDVIQLHPGALQVLQELADRKYPNSRIALASSANTALAEQCAHNALAHLEVLPGLRLRELVGRGFPADFNGNIQIGRRGKLSPDKTGHFRYIREETGVAYPDMVFFDDCNWEDNAGKIERNCPGVIAQATPHGLNLGLWNKCLDRYSQTRQRDGKAST